ncbi:MAG: sterol desaturase family protein [Myxococcota bacterium]
MIDLLGAVLLHLVWVAAVFTPLERMWPARGEPAGLRPAWRTDLVFYAAQGLLFTPAVAWVIHTAAAPLRNAAILAPAQAAFVTLPVFFQVVVVLVGADLFAYWGHRAQHAWEPLWRFHAIHHTAEHVDWLAAYREHPGDTLYTQALVNVPVLLLGFDLRAWLGLVVLRGSWAILVHSDVRLPLGPLRWIFGAPEFHRAHHDRDRHVGHYANLAPWLDVLFGTHGPVGEPARFGVNEPYPRSWVGMMVWPFRTRRRA